MQQAPFFHPSGAAAGRRGQFDEAGRWRLGQETGGASTGPLRHYFFALHR
jgi:hypothetical protein